MTEGGMSNDYCQLNMIIEMNLWNGDRAGV